MSDQPNWADIVAATAAVAGLGLTALTQAWGFVGSRRRRLQIHARRHNAGMCELDVEFDAMTSAANLQLEVAAVWPRGIFLLPDTSVIRTKEDGSTTIDGDWLGRQGAVTCRMAQKGTQYYASSHVWRMKSVTTAWLLVTVRDRSNQRAVARRFVRMKPMT